MDQIMSFVGRNEDLITAIAEAQNAANIWLQQHSASVGTIYSVWGESVWHERDGGAWYHIIMIALEHRVTSEPLLMSPS